jgi:serine/threonine protein kinase
MEFYQGDVIDGRFRVVRNLSDSGGMGKVLVVTDNQQQLQGELALKYCRGADQEILMRFRREVRIMAGFAGNSRVAQVYYANVEHNPPYFVMRYYPQGDLLGLIGLLAVNHLAAEQVFNLMIECIGELHAKNVLHRDIKPQNFLQENGTIVVSDLGLGAEVDSLTRFTDSLAYAGTRGFLPPEFHNGGFKHADVTSDIYMLGKTFYVLLTGRDPTYIADDGIHTALYYVIERCSEQNKTRRYASLAELRQSLNLAFDVVLGRGGAIGKASQLLDAIQNTLQVENKFYPEQIVEFLNTLTVLDAADKGRICSQLGVPFMMAISQGMLIDHIPTFLGVYKQMVEDGQYSWSFAETIADNMKRIFDAPGVPDRTKALALEIAIDGAERMNRFAAMNTCIAMITSVNDESLGALVAGVMQRNQHHFIGNIEPSQCRSDAIRRFLWAVKQANSN